MSHRLCSFVIGALAAGAWTQMSAQVHHVLEPPYRFAIYEARPYGKPGPPKMTLAVQSVRGYPTLQYRIRAELTIEGTTITLRLREIINDSDFQQDAVGPATFSAPVEVGSGTYELVFAAPSAEDRYRVLITDDAIVVTGPPGSLTIPPPTLYRIPRNSVYIHCMPAGFADHVCHDFFKLASLRARATTAGRMPPTRPNPFFYPLPMGQVYDSLPETFYLGVDSLGWAELGRFAADYTRIFQYAQYNVVLGLYNWNGAMAQCWGGVCHGAN